MSTLQTLWNPPQPALPSMGGPGEWDTSNHSCWKIYFRGYERESHGWLWDHRLDVGLARISKSSPKRHLHGGRKGPLDIPQEDFPSAPAPSNSNSMGPHGPLLCHSVTSSPRWCQIEQTWDPPPKCSMLT